MGQTGKIPYIFLTNMGWNLRAFRKRITYDKRSAEEARRDAV